MRKPMQNAVATVSACELAGENTMTTLRRIQKLMILARAVPLLFSLSAQFPASLSAQSPDNQTIVLSGPRLTAVWNSLAAGQPCMVVGRITNPTTGALERIQQRCVLSVDGKGWVPGQPPGAAVITFTKDSPWIPVTGADAWKASATNLNGTWYRDSDPGLPCSIAQAGTSIT